ncbi:MAG: energy transducer TonB [Acetobacter sp.]|nr:energy transducer TonB [Acetobacter sp.]MCH4062494.1 energy transducer TonB [Acetobacter sp.]MCH4088660.1 energy transducer TonB [Acetobacter sp.]MCI1292566.1 energy transducer TonB [Acetobacter sp.]MCI1319336.1 energy transducer TonB [Acetobacter sp.]
MVRPRRSETVRMQRSLALSVSLHALVVGAALLTLSAPDTPEPEEPPPIEVQFEGANNDGAPAKGEKPTPEPAPAPAPVPEDAPPAKEPPKPVPEEEAAPPPPPPPPVPPAPQQEAEPLPDLPVPPKEEAPTPEVVKQPPPTPAPPHPSAAVAPPSPVTSPTDNLPKIAIPSHITQPHDAKKTEPDTHSLLETLDSLRADTKQTHPPKAKANPKQGGSPNGGGTPDGDITQSMSGGDQKAIGASVRRCYTEDTAAKDYASFSAHLIVTVDATGVARIVTFAPETRQKMNGDSSYRALAERARAAVLSPTCSQLPIPKNLLGQTRQLKFVFRP